MNEHPSKQFRKREEKYTERKQKKKIKRTPENNENEETKTKYGTETIIKTRSLFFEKSIKITKLKEKRY